MDIAQQTFERKVGDTFVDWLNCKRSAEFEFRGRADQAPDLVYSDGTETITLEVTSAWYDSNDAKFWWQNLRGDPEAQTSWSGSEMDAALINDISTRIAGKCQNRYGALCILIVYVHPALTSKAEMDSLVAEILIPDPQPFAEIFLSGHFYMGSSTTNGAYSVWKLA